MERLALFALSIAWLGGWAALGYFVLIDDDGDKGEARATGAGIAPSADVRGCNERIRGGRPETDLRRDTVLGPVTLIDAPAIYRSSFRGRDYVTPDYLPGLNAHPLDVFALVAAGQQARIVVPRRQRRWMRLFYRPGDDTGQYAISLRACERSSTPFNGGLYVDFANAPRGGSCAELEVRVAAQSTTYRGDVFGPGAPACGGVRADVRPRTGRQRTSFTLRFRSAARLGVARDRRRSYRASVRGPRGRGCVSEADAWIDRGRPRSRLALRLRPGRHKRARWCRGRFQGTLARVNGYACPPRGPCQPPARVPRREQTVGRFSFQVR